MRRQLDGRCTHRNDEVHSQLHQLARQRRQPAESPFGEPVHAGMVGRLKGTTSSVASVASLLPHDPHLVQVVDLMELLGGHPFKRLFELGSR